MAGELKQIAISLWFEGQNPAIDKPREIGGVMQDTLDETIRFASDMIRAHWLGECDCSIPKAAEPMCKVLAAGLTDPPQDCDYPFCGCDPNAERVLDALVESGRDYDTALEAAATIVEKRTLSRPNTLGRFGLVDRRKDDQPSLTAILIAKEIRDLKSR